MGLLGRIKHFFSPVQPAPQAALTGMPVHVSTSAVQSRARALARIERLMQALRETNKPAKAAELRSEIAQRVLEISGGQIVTGDTIDEQKVLDLLKAIGGGNA